MFLALPFQGTFGNVGIAGHRDTFFRPVREIRPKDVITLTTPHGTFRYQWKPRRSSTLST
jgi:sortase (surface protein transpeptidase)